jgi:hypothetical protein
MSQPVLDYQGNAAPSGRFSRRAIWAVVFCAVCFATMVLLYLCFTVWLVKPSTVGMLFWVLIASFLATVVMGTRLRRPAIRVRGWWLAVVAVCLVPFSCLGTLPLFGPPAETIAIRFQFANRDHFYKIAEACRSYAAKHGSYPPHLAVLIAEGTISAEDLLDPFSHTTAAVVPSGCVPADWPKLVPVIDTHSDYIYVGAGLPEDPNTEVIILYDKPVSERGGRLIQRVISDDFVQDSDLARVFATDAATRAVHYLPAIKPP